MKYVSTSSSRIQNVLFSSLLRAPGESTRSALCEYSQYPALARCDPQPTARAVVLTQNGAGRPQRNHRKAVARALVWLVFVFGSARGARGGAHLDARRVDHSELPPERTIQFKGRARTGRSHSGARLCEAFRDSSLTSARMSRHRAGRGL